MKINWNKYLNYDVNVTLHENYGIVQSEKMENPFYEIVFKTGKLIEVFEDGLMLLAKYQDRDIEIFIPYPSIKCVEIIHPEKKKE
ncbi:MAG: hypothetical protein FJ213_09730 [Ignavibacteria bacterium]|nr:hypothetical protein [Ignavibacteria bacterium]